MTFCLIPKEFIRSVNASPNASFVLSTWMLKSPTISDLSTLTNRHERKSANYFRKSVYGPGGLYTVARVRDRTYLFCISDSVTLSIQYFECFKPVSCFLSDIENITIYCCDTAAMTVSFLSSLTSLPILLWPLTSTSYFRPHNCRSLNIFSFSDHSL